MSRPIRKASASWQEASGEVDQYFAQLRTSGSQSQTAKINGGRRRISVQEWQESQRVPEGRLSRPLTSPPAAHSERRDSRQQLEAQRVQLANRLETSQSRSGTGEVRPPSAASVGRPASELFTDMELTRVVARILSNSRPEATDGYEDEGDGSRRPSSSVSASDSFIGILAPNRIRVTGQPPAYNNSTWAPATPVAPAPDARHWAQVSGATLSACGRLDVPLVEQVTSALYRRYCAPPSNTMASAAAAATAAAESLEPIMNSNQWHRFAADCRLRGRGGLGGGVVLRGDVDIAFKTAIARITGAGTQV
jgi:hypothetical protein